LIDCNISAARRNIFRVYDTFLGRGEEEQLLICFVKAGRTATKIKVSIADRKFERLRHWIGVDCCVSMSFSG